MKSTNIDSFLNARSKIAILNASHQLTPKPVLSKMGLLTDFKWSTRVSQNFSNLCLVFKN